jgi:hypothetical protein
VFLGTAETKGGGRNGCLWGGERNIDIGSLRLERPDQRLITTREFTYLFKKQNILPWGVCCERLNESGEEDAGYLRLGRKHGARVGCFFF